MTGEAEADRGRRTCACGAIVTWPDPDEPVALREIPCPSCGRAVLFSQFRKMDVALSEACNYHCIHCRRPPDPLVLEQAEVVRAMEEGAAVGLDTVSFCGGEPFMHRHFLPIAAEAMRLGLKVQMVTHGGFATAKRVEKLKGIDCFTVSIDGPAAVHEKIRGVPGSWKKAADALVLAADAGIPRGINTVIQRDNADHLWDNYAALMDHTGGRIAYVRHAPVEIVAETAALQIPDEALPRVEAQLHRIAADCESNGIFFVHRTQLLLHLPRFVDKWQRHRPLGGCRIPRRFIGFSKLGFYLCWHQGTAIQATGLLAALRSPRAAAVVAEAAAGACVGCNALTYSWDEDWNAGILSGQLVTDGRLPDADTVIDEGGTTRKHRSRARLNVATRTP